MPVELSQAYMQQAQPKDVDRFIEAVIMQESSGNPKAKSKVGARGLMQIMPDTLKEYNQYKNTNYSINDLFNPTINRKIGTWYLYDRIPQMIDHFRPNQGFSPEEMLWAYNAGVGNMLKGIMPEETKNYINNIMTNFEGYKPKVPPTLTGVRG